MKNVSTIIISLCVLVVASTVATVCYRRLPFTIKTKELTLETASKEMPYINISAEEALFMQKLIQSPEVKAAIESKQTIGLSVKKLAELASGILPADMKASGFSMNDQVVYFEYYINDYRAILQLQLTDNSIFKGIVVASKNGDAKYMYKNFDNKKFEKDTFVRTFSY